VTDQKGLHSLQIENPGHPRDFDVLCWNVVKEQEVHDDDSCARARLHAAEPTVACRLYPDCEIVVCKDGGGTG
jgi:hypothetical protein